ncbi:NAD(P)-binding protein [Kribbella sp. NPDC051952]|uniref:NAD(P)-binding protein n=1 Tax=Kribbella sp. NPDC051952 TaxID=3154851 RepID=UPI0034276B9F
MGAGERSALIVGAGIGGLAAAVGLRRIGWSVSVLERAPIIAEVGAGLTLWPNAVKALAALGLDVSDRTVPTISRGNLLTPKGRWIRHSHPEDVGVLAIHRAGPARRTAAGVAGVGVAHGRRGDRGVDGRDRDVRG